ncbi:MAG: hypothetical protein NC452_04200 [Eubacterium sp.]|nr:hypothetical protein [Eubacterium sp.]
MRYRKLDENDDYTIGRRDEMHEGTEAVAQAVKTRLLLLFGEWWENRQDGTPLFEKVLGQRLRVDETPDEIDLVFSERINGTQGVSEITKFESRIDAESRAYTADITIKTVYDTEFSVSLSSGASPLEIKM